MAAIDATAASEEMRCVVGMTVMLLRHVERDHHRSAVNAIGGEQARPSLCARSLAGRLGTACRQGCAGSRPPIPAHARPPDDPGVRQIPPSSVSETAPGAAPRWPAARGGGRRRRDPELVVQVGEVLLHRGLGDHELVGDRARRRRLGEHVAGEQRAAERDEHVALARRQRRAAPSSASVAAPAAVSGSRKISRVWPTRISSPCRNRRDAQIRSPLTHVPLEEPRSVTHQPAGNRSSTACRWLAVGSSASATSFSAALPIVERSARELEAPAAHARDHLDLRCHAAKPMSTGADG